MQSNSVGMKKPMSAGSGRETLYDAVTTGETPESGETLTAAVPIPPSGGIAEVAGREVVSGTRATAEGTGGVACATGVGVVADRDV